MNLLQKIAVSCLVCYGQMITGGEMESKKPEWGSKEHEKARVAQFRAKQQALKKQQEEQAATDIQELNKQEPISSSSATAASSSLQDTPQELPDTDKSIESILQKFKRPVDDKKTKRIGIDIEQIASNFDTWIKTIEATSWKLCATDLLNELKNNNRDYIMIQFMNDNDDLQYAEYKYSLLTNRTKQYFLAINKRNKIKPDGSFDQNLYNDIESALKPPTQKDIDAIGNQLFEDHVKLIILQELGLKSLFLTNKTIPEIIDSMSIDTVKANLQKGTDALKKTQQEINALKDPIAILEKNLPKKGYLYGGPSSDDPNYKKILALKAKEKRLKIIRNIYINIGEKFLSRKFNDLETKKIESLKAIFEKLVPLTRETYGIISYEYLFGKTDQAKENEIQKTLLD